MSFAPGVGKDFEPSTSSESKHCRHFEFPEILSATKNFDKSLEIGKGGFGKVYKGYIIYGASLVVVAIKRLDPESSQGVEEFWSEFEILSTLRHCNIVSLIGYCNYEKEKILVYEYMPNGTLDDHLHKLYTPISWVMRLKICIDAGCGLRFLHSETGIDSGIIHRDVKSSNILLHENWAAKISDFGLSKTCPTNQPSTYVKTRVKGSFGYFDPSYYHTGMLTRKSDVYAFGVVLLEVLCRKRAVDKTLDEDQWSLVGWVQDSIKGGKIKHIIDSDIGGEISPKCLKEFIKLADRCLQDNPKQRPTMVEVVANLKNALNIQERINMQLVENRTIFGQMIDMLPFYSNGENNVHDVLKLPSDNSNRIPINPKMIEVPSNPKMKEVPAHFQSPNPSLKEYTLDDLEKATKKFSPDLLLGKGGFGKVFLGWVERNTLAPSKKGVRIAIAVKMLHSSNRSYAQRLAQAQVNFLEHLAHPNIIRLLGYCKNKFECLLVYEYMPNKTLNHFLFKDIAERLSWGTRLSIMIGVARGLTYLHSANLIHRSLHSSHIFLDDTFNAKIGGFSLVRHDDGDKETPFTATRNLIIKNDIYAFGVVLLESITGQKALDGNRSKGAWLLRWAIPILSDNNKLKEIIDPHLKDNYPIQGALECAALVLRCVAEKPKDRPSSEEVLQNLEQIYALQ